MKIRTTVLAVIGLLLAATSANAVPVNIDAYSCSSGNAINGVSTDDVTGNNGGSGDCFGTFSGNDPNGSADGIEAAGRVFDFIARSNVNENGTQSLVGANIGLRLYQPTDNSCEVATAMTIASSTGCWAFDPTLFMPEAFIVVLKAANDPGWAAWLFDGADAASSFGSWAVGWRANRNACSGHTNNNGTAGSGNCAAISHLTIFGSGTRTTVPEPGTLALLGLGLLGFGLTRRRKI
jgi:PEP-CTERM motif